MPFKLSSAEQRSCKPMAQGSIPWRGFGTRRVCPSRGQWAANPLSVSQTCGRSSVEERSPAKAEDAGSNPAGRSWGSLSGQGPRLHRAPGRVRLPPSPSPLHSSEDRAVGFEPTRRGSIPRGGSSPRSSADRAGGFYPSRPGVRLLPWRLRRASVSRQLRLAVRSPGPHPGGRGSNPLVASSGDVAQR